MLKTVCGWGKCLCCSTDLVLVVNELSHFQNLHACTYDFTRGRVHVAQDSNADLLRALLPTLIPILMKNTVYTDMDLAMLGSATDEDDYVPDRPQDVRPVFSHSKAGRAGDEDDEEDEDEDEDDSTEWSLRKCSAASMDALATKFGAEILPITLPELNKKLSDPEWRVRESGILTLGAVADGSYAGIEPHLAQLMPFLLTLVSDGQPLIRSISCWTVSRFAEWIMQYEDDRTVLQPVLTALVPRLLDRNKKVQEVMFSSFFNA
jgi:transportin-1